MNPIERSIESLDWMTIALVLSLLILSLSKYLFQTKFLNFLVLPFNNKYILLSNKKGRLFHWFHIFITFFQYINLALFIFLINKLWRSSTTKNSIQFFFTILVYIILFQLIKILVQWLKGFVFDTTEMITDLIYEKISYFNHSSLVMFISNVILIYVLKDSKIVIYIALGLILSINAIGLFKLLKDHQKVIVYYLFYFILYLCALEIAPLVVIGSYLKG